MSETAGIGPDLAAVSWAVVRLWHRDGKWANVRLEGISMHPLIQDGARLRVRFGTFAPAALKVGDLVIYSPREAAPEGQEGSLPSRRLIAHRVVRIGRRGKQAGLVYVKGDPLSTWRASWIRVSEILGRVAAVTQPDGRRLHLNTPAGRALARAAAWVSRSCGFIDAHLPRKPTDPMRSLTGQSLSLLRRGYDAVARRFEQADEPAGSWVLSVEERFIIAACRPWLSAEDAERLRARAREVLDWDQVRAQAVALGLAPLMFRNLSDPRAQDLCPAGFMEKVGRASHVSGYLTMQRRAELARVLNTLGDDGIEPVLLKGAALANTVYDDPALRTMNDLDLLVRPGEIVAASAALTALSYRELYRAALADPQRRHAFYGKHHHTTPLVAPRGRAVVELHRHILTMTEAGAYDVERIRARARRVALPRLRGLHRPEVLVPCPADMVLHTCLHLSYTDRFVGKLRDLIDLHETVRRFGAEIDWGQILAEVPNEAVARCLFSCLDLARRLYGTQVPEDFLHELRRHARMGPVGSGLLRALACSALFNSASSRTVLTAATVRWCCDTLLRRAGWTARLRALASLLAEG